MRRTLLPLLVMTACSSQSSNGAGRKAAPVTWKHAWSNPLRSSLIAAADVVVLREDGAVPRSAALDPTSGEVRWQVDAMVESPDAKALYTVVPSDFEFLVRKLDPANGHTTWSRRMPRSSGLEYAVVLADALLAIDRQHVRAVSFADNATLWDQELRIDQHGWVRPWRGSLIFETPYTSIAADTGRVQWQIPGCCVAVPVSDTRAVLQQEGQVVVVDRAGKVARTIPGKVVAAGDGGVILEDSEGLRAYVADGDRDTPVKLPGGPAKGSLAFDHGYVYYTTVDGAVMELDIRANTASEIRAAKERSTPVADDILIPPIIAGDRVYVSDDGWHAFDRSHPRAR